MTYRPLSLQVHISAIRQEGLHELAAHELPRYVLNMFSTEAVNQPQP
jgi:hypothetical protein